MCEAALSFEGSILAHSITLPFHPSAQNGWCWNIPYISDYGTRVKLYYAFVLIYGIAAVAIINADSAIKIVENAGIKSYSIHPFDHSFTCTTTLQNTCVILTAIRMTFILPEFQDCSSLPLLYVVTFTVFMSSCQPLRLCCKKRTTLKDHMVGTPLTFPLEC